MDRNADILWFRNPCCAVPKYERSSAVVATENRYKSQYSKLKQDRNYLLTYGHRFSVGEAVHYLCRVDKEEAANFSKLCPSPGLDLWSPGVEEVSTEEKGDT